MHEEDIDLRFRPGNLETSAVKETLVDRPPVRIGAYLAVLQAAKGIGRIEVRRTIAVVQIDQVLGTAVEGKTIDSIRLVRYVDFRLVKSGDEPGIAILCGGSEKADSAASKKARAVGGRAGLTFSAAARRGSRSSAAQPERSGAVGL